MATISDERYENSRHAFISVMKKYIIPLLPGKMRYLDIEKHIVRKTEPSQYNRLINYDKDTGLLTVVPSKKNPAFTLEAPVADGKQYNMRVIEAVFAEMTAVIPPMTLPGDQTPSCCNECQLIERLFEDPSEIYFDAVTDIAFEKGLSVWLGGTGSCGLTIFRVLHKLERWTRKTYEGRHVSFGVIIDKDLECGSMDYVSFLDNRNSALVSDGIFSAVYIDRYGKLIKSLSTVFGADFSDENADDILAPYEYIGFADACRDNRIGIIAMASGDILIIKDGKLIFCKRNDEWNHFNHEEMIEKISEFLSESDFNTDRTEMWEHGVLAREIYKTVIDVSFAHTGGCIGICTDPHAAAALVGSNTLTYGEYISGKYDDPTDMNADIRRKRAIAGFIWYDGKKRGFADTKRKLRMECASFDGAVMIDTDGEYITVGSIVKVSPGGDGGRTLAARSLACVGLGIKISSDGAVTAFKGKDAEIIFSVN